MGGEGEEEAAKLPVLQKGILSQHTEEGGWSPKAILSKAGERSEY